MLFDKLKWSLLLFISFSISTCFGQDKIRFYKGEVLEVKITEVGTDSISYLTKAGKKHETQHTISNQNVSYLEYANGDQHFIPRDIINLVKKAKLAKILEVGEEFVTYIDILDKYYNKPKVYSIKEIVSITFSNGEILRFFDAIYPLSDELILGQIIEVDVNKILYTNTENIKAELDLSMVEKIIFKNGTKQEFGDLTY